MTGCMNWPSRGYKIPCFLWADLGHEDTLYCRFAVCYKHVNYVEICVANRVFIDDMDGREHFKRECEKLEVRFIVPNVKETEK